MDGTFNRHFQKLSQKERQANLDIAKKVGFLFPAFKDRSSDIHRIDIYAADGKLNQAEDLRKILFAQHESCR